MDESAAVRLILTLGFTFTTLPGSGAAAKALLRFIEEGFCNEKGRE
jgi:hypothetical protein